MNSQLLRIAGLVVALILGVLSSARLDVNAEQPSTAGARSNDRSSPIRRWIGRSPRGKIPNQIGKNHQLVRSAFRDVVTQSNRSTVRIMSDGEQVGLGTVVDARGYLITKASEMREPLTCRVPGLGERSARIVGHNRRLDLALLKLSGDLSGEKLVPAAWSSKSSAPAVGSWVAVPGGFGREPLVVGVVSSPVRPIARDVAILGIVIENDDRGLLVKDVLPGSGAAQAGLRPNDYVRQIEDVAIRTGHDLIREVRSYRPGQTVRLKIRRGDQELDFRTQLGRPHEIAQAEHGLLAHEGGPLSGRRSDFSRVIQHDCLIEPHQCGGPLVDVNGHVIGVNIARAGRVASYALPADVVQPAVQRLLLAAKN